jgi:hypothetical protein
MTIADRINTSGAKKILTLDAERVTVHLRRRWITMYNNPAFQACLMATVEPYRMGWVTGEDQRLAGAARALWEVCVSSRPSIAQD